MKSFPRFVLASLFVMAFATMAKADPFFDGLRTELAKSWPNNRTIRLVFHGHSVPAGYFRAGNVRTFDAYPRLLHRQLCEQYPTAVIDVCVTAIGGENSVAGARRFSADVLPMHADIVFIDYALNDRHLGLEKPEHAWREMIREATAAGVQVVLLTPTPDSSEDILDENSALAQHADQVRRLANELKLPVVDSFEAFRTLVKDGADINDFLSQPNHPNRAGHEVVAKLLLELFSVQLPPRSAVKQ